jgi:hypothetical protein
MTGGVDIAILARAPVTGEAKTRLIPAIGPRRAARLHRQLVLRTLAVARNANLGGDVVLWGTPSISHRFFRALKERGMVCREQPAGDLGERMRSVLAATLPRPTLLIGTDCPILKADHLKQAAQALLSGHDAVFLPAEDGGYVLIGLRSPAHPLLFDGVLWGTQQVMTETRERLARLGYRWAEPAVLWDVDTPEDLARVRRANLLAFDSH